jgi:hypothetical protein
VLFAVQVGSFEPNRETTRLMSATETAVSPLTSAQFSSGRGLAGCVA